jgi:hypothetical protein
MRIRIAIMAAALALFTFAQSNLAQAAYAGATESKSVVTSANVGSLPAIRLAQNKSFRKPGSNPGRGNKCNDDCGDLTTLCCTGGCCMGGPGGIVSPNSNRSKVKQVPSTGLPK